MDGTVIVADDDRTVRTVLAQALSRAGCQVHATGTATQLMRWIEEGRGDVVITDVMLPDGNGLELLKRIRQLRGALPVLVISAQNTIMTALRAEEERAWDYLPKPFDLPELMRRVAVALREGAPQNAPLPPLPDEPLVGRSAPMQALFRQIAKLAKSDLPILITGESGSGKSRIARVLHAASHQAQAPLVPLDPANPQAAAEAAQGQGTLLLEDVQDLDAQAQRAVLSLLRAPLSSGRRVLATGQREGVAQLRPDLYFRLAGAVIEVPPLRARREDIPLHLAQVIPPQLRVSGEAMEALVSYAWPGNLRQLDHVGQTLARIAQGGQITLDLVNEVLSAQPGAAEHGAGIGASVAAHLREYFDRHNGELPPAGLYQRILREVEIPLIEIALEATGGNQLHTAQLLGLNRNTLRKKMQEHEITVTRRRKLM